MNNNKTFAQAVFQITDLVKLIGSYKKELENHDNKKNMLIELMDFMRYCELQNDSDGLFANKIVTVYTYMFGDKNNFLKDKINSYLKYKNCVN